MDLELIGAFIADHIQPSDLLAGKSSLTFYPVDALQEPANKIRTRSPLDEDPP